MDEGAIPFTCQGSDNGLTIEGGETLGYEMAADLPSSGERLDRIVIQVGRGAGDVGHRGFHDAIALGAGVEMPTIDTVQTRGAWPLRRTWQRFAHRVLLRAGHHELEAYPDRELAQLLQHLGGGRGRERVGRDGTGPATWAWEEEPVSIAEGILDDETYDWAAVLEGMVRTGGVPVVVDDATIADANERARTGTGIDVSHTGSAGLAGLIALRASGDADPGERVAVLFTGVRRRSSESERGEEQRCGASWAETSVAEGLRARRVLPRLPRGRRARRTRGTGATAICSPTSRS